MQHYRWVKAPGQIGSWVSADPLATCRKLHLGMWVHHGACCFLLVLLLLQDQIFKELADY